MRAVIKCALVRIPDWSNNAKKRAWSIALKLIEYRNTAGSALGSRPAPPGRGAFSFFYISLKEYDFGVTLSRLRPGKAFKAAERISSCLEHTLLCSSEHKKSAYGRIGVSGDWNAPDTGGMVSLTDTFRLQSNGY